MSEPKKQVGAVRRAAVKAWHSTERKFRRAVETAVAAKEELDQLETIISGAGKTAITAQESE